MKKYNKFYNIAFLLFAFVMVSCGYEPEVERAGTRPDLSTSDVLNTRGYNILQDAITHAGLDEALQGSDSLTLLAPTDAAFEALLGAIGVSSITDVASETVATILSYHVIPAPAFSGELPRSISALDGNTIYFSTAGGVSANGKAVVVEPDMVSRTAVIHGINKVLEVPVGNLFQQMQANDSLTTLVSAIESAGLESLFTGATEYTIFAPSNSAFEGVDLAALTEAQLVDILGFHVIPDVAFSQELVVTGRIATIQGNSVDDNVQEITKDETALNDAILTNFNTVANNGVIHIVDAIIEKEPTIIDVFGPVDVTGLDTDGYDQFGSIIAGLEYPLSLADTLSYYAPADGVSYDTFDSDEEATMYIENHIFTGNRNFWTGSNGTKISSVNGSEYYIVTGLIGTTTVRYINGIVPNARVNANSVPTTAVNSAYFTTLSLADSAFTPLPEDNIVEILSENENYSLFVALVEKLGLTASLSGGNLTVFPVNNAVFTAGTEITTVEEIEGLDEEDDAEFLADLAEIAANHVVVGANFSRHIIDFLPALETLGETTLQFALVSPGDELRIILDPSLPNTENVGLVSVDVLASNGVIHEVDGFIVF